MKKTYIEPKVKSITLDTETLLASSGPGIGDGSGNVVESGNRERTASQNIWGED